MIIIVLLTFECTFTAVKTVTQIFLLFLCRVSQRKHQVGWHGFPFRTKRLIMGSFIEFFMMNQQNSRSRYYTPTSTNSLSLIRVSNSGKGSDRSVSSSLLPNNWLPHNLSLYEKKKFSDNQLSYCCLINERFPCKSILYFLCWPLTFEELNFFLSSVGHFRILVVCRLYWSFLYFRIICF